MRELVARLHTVLDTGDLAPIDELIHPNYLNHEAAPGGRDGFRHTVKFLRGAFPDLRLVSVLAVVDTYARSSYTRRVKVREPSSGR